MHNIQTVVALIASLYLIVFGILNGAADIWTTLFYKVAPIIIGVLLLIFTVRALGWI